MIADVTISPGYNVPPATRPRGYHERSSNQFQKDSNDVLTKCFEARKLNQGSNSWMIDSNLNKLDKLLNEVGRGIYRMTEKRREEIAAPAIVARIRTLRRDCMLSLFCLDIRVSTSNIFAWL